MDLFLCLQFPRSAAKSHSQTQIESHLSLALRGLEATQYQVHELVTVVKEQSQQIERQSQQIEKLISKDKEQSKKMERPRFTAQDQPLERERHWSMDEIFSTPFEWEIPINQHVSERYLFIKHLVSEPFYLFRGGYKYRLKISSLSSFRTEVSIKVVPGDYDDSLSWPCKEKVRVTLMDQCQPLANLNSKSRLNDFGKGKEPCSRPRHDDYHEYRSILVLTKQKVTPCIRSDTILLRVTSE